VVYHAQMDLVKHSDCQRSPKARTSLLARSWVYNWLSHCSDKSQKILWTQERANKLALAFVDRWQSECFPNSIWFW